MPLYVYGEILPQRGKKWRKTDILFCGYAGFDSCTLQIDKIVDSYPRRIQRSEKAREQNKKKGRIELSVFLARTCSACAFQQRCCFFAVTNVTPKEEIGEERERNFAKCRRKKARFLLAHQAKFEDTNRLIIKIAQTNTQATEKEPFTDTAVTLVTAKRQKLL